MMALVSTTMCGSPLRSPAAAAGSRERMRPIASAATIRSARLATVSPSIPRPNRSDTPSGSHVPNGSGNWDSGRPEQEAHQQADQQADDRGHELGGRQRLDPTHEPERGDDRQVRQDGEPDDDPGDDPGGQERAGVRAVREERLAVDLDARQREADQTAERGAKDADVADQRIPRRFPTSRATIGTGGRSA